MSIASEIRSERIEIPRSLDSVTAGWLGTALSRRYPGTEVLSIRIEPLKGYKPNKARAFVEYAGHSKRHNLPPTLIIKGCFVPHGTSESKVLHAGLDLGMEIEARAYRDILPTQDVNTPRCFFADVDPDTGAAAVVLEDLTVRNVTFCSAFAPLSYEQAAAFLDVHAKFHSNWWNSPALQNDGKFGPNSEFGKCNARIHLDYLSQFLEAAAWNALTRLPRCAALPKILLDRERMGKALARLEEFNRTCPRTIVHGDEHPGNYYIEVDGAPGLLDWCAREEPWSFGFAYFLTTALDAIDRRHWEQSLLAHYLRRLNFYGVDSPSFEEAWLAYRCAVVFPLFCWMINSSQYQPEAINTAYASRAGAAAIDHAAFDLLAA